MNALNKTQHVADVVTMVADHPNSDSRETTHVTPDVADVHARLLTAVQERKAVGGPSIFRRPSWVRRCLGFLMKPFRFLKAPGR